MNKSDNVPMMYEVFPAVAALNQVKGFNPLKMLRKMVSPKTGEEVLRLDLQYKKLWFRLRYPEGRIRVHPLRITEQLAIYEAQVFLNRDDHAPVCSFTSSISKDEAPNGKYIQAAQDEAVDNALSDAGFGIQLSDVATPESMRHYGSEIPVSKLSNGNAVAEAQVKTAQKTVVHTPSAPEQSATAVQQSPADKASAETEIQTGKAEVKKPVSKEATVQQVSVRSAQAAAKQPSREARNTLEIPGKEPEKPSQEAHAAHSALEVLRGGNSAPAEPAQVVPVSKPAQEPVSDDSDLPFTFGPRYNNDMTPEEIVKVMSLEEAKAVVVDSGMCKGMTMSEVAEKRPANLKFYLFGGYRGNNNILKAAAKIMYDQLPKAG